MGQGCQIAGTITGAIGGVATGLIVAGAGAGATTPIAVGAGTTAYGVLSKLGSAGCDYLVDDDGNMISTAALRSRLERANAQYDAYFGRNQPPPKPTMPRWLAPVGITLGAVLLGGIVFAVVRR